MSTLFGYTKLGPQRYRERFGLAFEDFIVGQIFDYRPDVTITQQDNLEWKQNLRVNTLALQRLFGMTSRTSYRRSNLLGVDESATTGPVFGGDTLYARTRVIGKAEGADANAGVLDLVTEGINQRQEIVARIRYRIDLLKTGRHPEDWLLGNGTIAEEERFRSHHPTADGALVEQTSLYFEDFVEGETFEHWPGKWISAAESARHAQRSLEIHPRYSDLSYAASVIDHAMNVFEPLVIGGATALMTQTFGRAVANPGWTDIRLPRAVRPVKTIRAVSTIGGKRLSARRPTQGILSADTTAYGEGGTMVCSFKRAFLIYRQGVGPCAAAGC